MQDFSKSDGKESKREARNHSKRVAGTTGAQRSIKATTCNGIQIKANSFIHSEILTITVSTSTYVTTLLLHLGNPFHAGWNKIADLHSFSNFYFYL